MTRYACARVSFKTQNLARQIDRFLALGIPKSNIFSDKLSGKDFDRKNHERLLRKLKMRCTRHCKHRAPRKELRHDLKRVDAHHKDRRCGRRGAGYAPLGYPHADGRPDRQVRRRPCVADPLLCRTKGAQKHKERQREGIASAKKRGEQSGRPSVLQPDAFSDIVRRYREKTISFDEALSLANYLLYFIFFVQILPPSGRARPHTRPRSVSLLQHSLFFRLSIDLAIWQKLGDIDT